MEQKFVVNKSGYMHIWIYKLKKCK